jgi:hypothetical protein
MAYSYGHTLYREVILSPKLGGVNNEKVRDHVHPYRNVR